MAIQIITKNSATAGSVPAANALAQGELAINVKDRKLFSKDADGSVFELSGSQTGTNTLQQVTDAGNTTTNDIEIGGGNIELKASNGSITAAGDVSSGSYDDSKDNTKGVKIFSNGSVRVQRESTAAENAYSIANYSGNTLNWTVRANGTQQIGGNIGAGIDSGSPNISLKSDGSAQFSGSVSIGGTGTANTIDEYEEGQWTPDVTNTNGDPRTGVAISKATYRRIGGIVTCSLQLDLDADESTLGFRFSLPFVSGAYGCCSIVQASSINGDTLNGYISGGNMRCGFPTDHTSGTKDYRGSFTYKIT
ncbi:MAG TPA: hypothetical protein DCQ67_01980 [Acidimicrobiaceae bacterium]|jgi:hypothetical protein|nr:hypothetical protein [Acidimicrobiaceae bacterium]|tara:strand:- start:850 stop:1770 length:921 start_codon:yes stop_codon:yes gene_type:complete